MSLVLVADDEPAVLEVLTEVVEDLGHEVLRAHDGREALALARQQHPNLVVTDHMMPRLSGVELCRALRNEETLRAIPVILLSAALPPEATEASAYLAKPFELDEFESLVKRTLDGANPRASNVVLPPRPAEASAQLLHWAAHELKTPLAAAKAHLQLLDRKLPAGFEVDRHHLDTVSRQLDEAGVVLEAMLDASRLEAGAMVLSLERVELRELVSRLVGEWRARHPEAAVELEAPEHGVEALADPTRVTQVLSFLFASAIRQAGPSPRLQVELERLEGQVEVRIRDVGSGPTRAMQDDRLHLVTPEWDGDADAPPRVFSDSAMGLGLFVATRMVRLHGGVLNVRNAGARGALFTVALPRAR